jgi:hypothetical protein
MAKYIVTLTEEERSWLRHWVSAGQAAARKLTHARTLLLAEASPPGPASNDEDIQQAWGVGLSTIYRVRQQFVMKSIESALESRPSPAPPPQIKSQGGC